MGVQAVNQAPKFLVGKGVVTTPIGLGLDQAYSVAIQSDGKIITAGFSYIAGNTDFALVRYNTDGSLDTSFGVGAKVTTAIGLSDEKAYGLTLQHDGKILVTGYTASTGSYLNDFAILRYNSDGSLDTSFGGTGKVITKVSARSETAYGLSVQPDGKIIAAGDFSNGTANGGGFNLVRYNTDGSLDTSFGGTGRVTTLVGSGSSSGRSISLQADGKILVAGEAVNGSSNSDFALVRYNTNGSLDTSFGTVGKVITDIRLDNDGGRGVAVQPDGKILLVGEGALEGRADFTLVRYNSDGSLDTSFGVTGKVTTSIGTSSDAKSITVQSDGKIVVAGIVYKGNFGSMPCDIAVARYNSDGSLDSSFGNNGKITTAIGSNSFGQSVTLQSDGKVVVAGYTEYADGNSDFALVRYSSNGISDITFGSEFTTEATSPNNSISYIENGDPVVLWKNLAISDVDLIAQGNYSGSSISLGRNGNLQIEDQFSGTGVLSALIEGARFSVNGIEIGTVAQNSGGKLVLTFNSSATSALVNAALSNIGYRNSSDAPQASAQISWLFSDGNTGVQGTGGALTAAASTTVNVTAVNDNFSGSLTISGTAKQGQILTAVSTLADADGLGAIAYQWKADGVNISGATGATLTLGQAQVGKTITVTASYTDLGGTAERVTSSATSAVANLNHAPTGSVTINGIAIQGRTLTVTSSLADADGIGAISYQWKANGVSISGATGGAFTVGAEQVGKKISVTASYTDQKGTLEIASSDISYLKTSYDLAQPKQWLSGKNLVDLAGVTYIKDSVLNVMQTAQLDLNNDGLDDLITYSSYPLDIPTPNPPPVIFINNGQLLQQVAWTGATLRNPHGVKILVGDFNGDSLPDLFSLVDIDQPFGAFPNLKDFNHLLINSPNGFTKAIEFDDMPGYWCAGASGDIDGDGDLDVVMFNFHVQNNKVQSQILWNDGNANFTYDSRGIGEIPIVDIAEFRDVNRDGYLDLVIDHIGLKSFRTPIVSVMWGNGTGFSLSNATDFILANDAYVGDICFADLNADGFDEILIGGVNDVGVFWFRIYQSNDKGVTFTDVSHQLIDFNTSTVGFSHLYVTDIDQDGLLDVFSPNQDDGVHWEWNGTQFIKQNTPAKGVVYLVFNSVKQGDQLVAVANLSDVDGLGTYSYQWFRGATEIPGSNSSTYTLTQADVNQTVSVKVGFTDARGNWESMTSNVSPVVSNTNDAPLGNISFSGQIKQGQTLNAVSTLSDVDGMGTISYQWRADGLNIQGATSSSMLLSQSQVGKMISLTASYTDGMGTLENFVTPPSGPVLAAPSLTGQIYQWKSHTLLSGVVTETTASTTTSTTNDAGTFSLNELPVGNLQLKPNLALTNLETGSAINSADALAALKIAVGRSPNADGSPASPYQLIAADVNQDGKVTSADALAILKMAVKRSDAPAREWLFVNESQDFWDESANNGQGGYTISRTNVTWNKDLQATVTQDTTVNLIAVLKGDVNGSWTGATTGTQNLPNTYFSDLVKKGLGPLSTWGVVAA